MAAESNEIIANQTAFVDNYVNVSFEPFVIPSHPTSSRTRRPIKKVAEGLPDLSPSHLLTVFIESGITAGDAYALGLLLGLPRESLASSRFDHLTNHPSSYYAMEIVGKWRDKYPMSLKEAHKELAIQLRKIKFNFVIPNLQGKERKEVVDPLKVTNFLSDGAKNFTKRQAYNFGNYLQFTSDNLNEIEQNMRGTVTGMSLVLEIFQKIDRSRTNFGELLLSEIVAAFISAAQIEDTEEFESIMNMLKYENEPRATLRQTVRTDNHDDVSTHNEQATTGGLSDVSTAATEVVSNRISVATLRKNAYKTYKTTTKRWPLVVLAVIAFLLIIAVIILIFTPPLPSLPKQVLYPHDVVLYKIPHSDWITSVSIELEGSALCSALVVSVRCSDIQQTSTSIERDFKPDYIYLEEDALLSLPLNNTATICTPYYAWIFNDHQAAKTNSNNNFEDLACNNPPNGIWCIKLNENKEFAVPLSNYYSIRCDRGPQCSEVDSIRINTSQYNITTTREVEIDSVTIQTRDREETLKIKENNFSPFSQKEEVCLLMQLSDSLQCREGKPPIYHVAFLKQERRRDLLLYPLITLFLIIVISVVVFSIKACYTKFHRN